jgi:hypothetical protein
MIDGRSVLWSVGIVCLSVYALRHGWHLQGDALNFHLSRAFWWGWLSSNAFNLFVQLRGLVPQRADVEPVIETTPSSPLRYVWRRVHVREAVYEGLAPLPDARPPHVPPLPAPDEIALPEIVYVPDQGGNFIPVERVPVERVRR